MAIILSFFGSIAVIVFALLFPEHTSLYKQGQVDALSGKVLFELKDKSDGTREWVRK